MLDWSHWNDCWLIWLNMGRNTVPGVTLLRKRIMHLDQTGYPFTIAIFGSACSTGRNLEKKQNLAHDFLHYHKTHSWIRNMEFQR